ncbi:SIR2 family protein [Terribacillus halophilus]|uniref:SIR2 family protein n=1 Tax=Terribacillus halophilus TaxID=361279 RepID=UPI0015C3B3A3|nr:SIR2 family protein [Terribacillus halophilus]
MATENQVGIIGNIASDLVANKTVFFVGAGFSRDLGYPGWGELLKQIISDHQLMDKIKESNLFYMLTEAEHEDYAKINDMMLNNLIGVDFLRLAGYVDILLEEYANTNIRAEIVNKIRTYEHKRQISGEKYQSYKKLFQQLKPYISEIITTNYDTNLEHCLDSVSVIHRNLKSINNSTRYNPRENVKLYKIHGCITDENTQIVITEKDYQEFNMSNTYLFNKLYSTFMENNIVFIGYSLSDPNIRSLLKEIIDETKKAKLDEKKKVYWINRDKVNEIDKTFYRTNYSVQIIDEIELDQFLTTLNVLSEYKVIEGETLIERWTEVGDRLLKDTKLTAPVFKHLVDEVVQSGMTEQVLKHIYSQFNVDSGARVQADTAFFKILSAMDPSQREQQQINVMVTDILGTEDNHLLGILELIEKDAEIKELFLVNPLYSSSLLRSLLSRAITVNDFYYYKIYSIGLLTYYRLFEGELGEYRNDFTKAFYSNYRYMTRSKSLGYSYNSLNEVEEELDKANLDYEIVKEIVDHYPSSTKNKFEIEQIGAIISYLDSVDDQMVLYFTHIMKPLFEVKTYRSLYKYLKEEFVDKEGFEYEVDEDLEEMFVKKDQKVIGYRTLNTSGSIEIEFYFNAEIIKLDVFINYELRKVQFNIGENSMYLKDELEIEQTKEFILDNIKKFIASENV